MVNIMNDVFFQIPNLFMGKSENSILTIKKKNNQYQLSVSEQSNLVSRKLTCRYLKELIGTDRLKQICRKSYIDIDLKKNRSRFTNYNEKFYKKIFYWIVRSSQR